MDALLDLLRGDGIDVLEVHGQHAVRLARRLGHAVNVLHQDGRRLGQKDVHPLLQRLQRHPAVRGKAGADDDKVKIRNLLVEGLRIRVDRDAEPRQLFHAFRRLFRVALDHGGEVNHPFGLHLDGGLDVLGGVTAKTDTGDFWLHGISSLSSMATAKNDPRADEHDITDTSFTVTTPRHE